jgi:hypothetical protein
MKYQKLNTNWNADPNDPDPQIKQSEKGVELIVQLNSFIYEHVDHLETGKLEFEEVYAYRLGKCNDEGYYMGQFRYNPEQLPWGQFYELKNSNWQKDLPEDKILLNESLKKNKLRHFLFFLKDNTFECLAYDYSFKYLETQTEILSSRYPKGYFKHYLAMFATQFSKPSLDSFQIFTDLYIQMEGQKEFTDLKEELKLIQKNKDQFLFSKFINYFGIEKFEMKNIDQMIKKIEKF